MAMSDPTRDFREPSLKNAQFEGYAIVTDDPDKRQRVRVRIPVLHRDISDDKLPWANSQGGGMSNAGAGVGTVMVPDRFSKVTVTFPEDDPHNPQYSFSPASDDVNKDNELLGEDYPNSYGQIDSHGNRVSVNKATGDMTIAHKSGAIIHIDGSGNVAIGGAADVNIGAKNNINIAAGGRINLSASGDVNLNGANIQLNSGGGSSPNIPGSRPTPQIQDQSGKTDL